MRGLSSSRPIPLTPAVVQLIAVHNYRQNGGGGYPVGDFVTIWYEQLETGADVLPLALGALHLVALGGAGVLMSKRRSRMS